jgi:iron complex outermembrane receptor protein
LFQYNETGDVTSYELGLKSQFLDQTLRVNLAAFHVEWEKQHASIQTTSVSTLEFYNVPKLEISGAEVEIAWLPMESLALSLALNYLHGKQTDGGLPSDFIDPTGAGTQTDDNIVSMPEWSGALGVTWNIARLDWGNVALNVDAMYTDEYWTTPKSGIPVDAHTVINARLSVAELHAAGGRLEIGIWAKNLLDEDYKTYTYDGPGIVSANTFGTFGDPRTMGISATYRY